jgi:hypothetical protein
LFFNHFKSGEALFALFAFPAPANRPSFMNRAGVQDTAAMISAKRASQVSSSPPDFVCFYVCVRTTLILSANVIFPF